MSAHTPTPWFHETRRTLARIQGTAAPGERLVASGVSPEDAEHIVRCVNAHDELVEALRKIVDVEDDAGKSPYERMSLTATIARVALAKAGCA